MRNKIIIVSLITTFISIIFFGMNVFAYVDRNIDTYLLPYQQYAYTSVGDQQDGSKQYFEASVISTDASNFSANACIDKKVWWGWDRASHFIYLNDFDVFVRGDFGRNSVSSGTAIRFAIQNGNNSTNIYEIEVIVRTN